MSDRKAFLLRVDPAVYEALQKWANDDLRSLNGQIEYLLREALRQTRRLEGKDHPPARPDQEEKSN